jgi:hypothetical protein
LDGQLAAGLSKFYNVSETDLSKRYEVTVYASFDASLLGVGITNGVVTRKLDPDNLNQTKTIVRPGTDPNISLEYNYPRKIAETLNNKTKIWDGADRVSKVNIIMENASSYYAERNASGEWIEGLL